MTDCGKALMAHFPRIFVEYESLFASNKQKNAPKIATPT